MLGSCAELVYPGRVSQEAPADPLLAASPGAVEDALGLMREHGGRATPARRLLLEALLTRRGHRSAEELGAEVQARAPDVHMSTISRNLDEMERLQIVDRTCLGHGPATYHLASAAHGHLACEKCGTITEIPAQLFDHLAEMASTRYGFTIQPHRFAVTGLCTNCQ